MNACARRKKYDAYTLWLLTNMHSNTINSLQFFKYYCELYGNETSLRQKMKDMLLTDLNEKNIILEESVVKTTESFQNIVISQPIPKTNKKQNILHLNENVVTHICSFFDLRTNVACQYTCRHFCKLARHQGLKWKKSIDIVKYPFTQIVLFIYMYRLS